MKLPIFTSSWLSTFARWRGEINAFQTAQEASKEVFWCSISSGSSNAYILESPVEIVSFTDGQRFLFKASFTNSGAATVKISNSSVTTIVRPGGADLSANDIVVDNYITLLYDGLTDKMVLTGTSSSTLLALSGVANGILVKTGANTYTSRSIAVPTGMSIANADGVAGNPTISLANDLSALEAMSGTGIVARTASETYAQRTITGTTDVLTVTNGDGVSGAPTLDIATRYRAGWIPANENWTYASATTITVPTDATTKYSKGDKIHLVQSSTDKFFYIIAVAATTLTIDPNTDYTLTNSAISSNEYSKVLNPFGFPQSFAYTPTFTGFSADPSVTARFTLIGTKCFVTVVTGTGTSNATSFIVSVPVTAKTVTGLSWINGGNNGTDNGAYQNNVLATINSAATAVTLNPQGGSVNWTNTGNKAANFQINYDI